MRTDVRDKAVRILHQMAAVDVELAELARELGAGGNGAFEDELGRLWRALAAAVESGLDVADVAARVQRDPWTEKPSVLTFWGNLSVKQEKGSACVICGGDFGTHPGKPSVVLSSKQTFVHCDAEVCTQVLAEKLEKEVPF